MIIKFHVDYPSGEHEEVLVEGPRAVLGSGAHCDVRLAMDQAAYEHVVIEAVGDALRAEAKAEHPRATVNGMPFSTTLLPPGATVEIGGTRVSPARLADVPGARGRADKKNDLSPVSVFGLVFIAAAVAFFAIWDGPAGLAPAPAGLPDLFGKTTPKCPLAGAAEAKAYAEEQIDIAESKRERIAFAVKDGVEAVRLYETAAACFDLAGAQALRREADEWGKALKESLTREFRTRSLRLTHALKVEDYELAASDWRVLHELLGNAGGAHVDWLGRVGRLLESKGLHGASLR